MQGLLDRIETTSDATKKDSFFTTFKKKLYIGRLFKFSARRVLCALWYILNKANWSIVQNSEAAREFSSGSSS